MLCLIDKIGNPITKIAKSTSWKEFTLSTQVGQARSTICEITLDGNLNANLISTRKGRQGCEETAKAVGQKGEGGKRHADSERTNSLCLQSPQWTWTPAPRRRSSRRRPLCRADYTREPFLSFRQVECKPEASTKNMFLYAGADGQMKVRTRANMEKGGDNMTIGRHHGREEKTGTSSRPARPGLLTQNMCALHRDHPYTYNVHKIFGEDLILIPF